MPRWITFSRILPLAIIVVSVVVVGVSMISVIRSEDRKDQAVWDEVLHSDLKMSVRAKKTMQLVDRLAALQDQSQVDPSQIETVKEDIGDLWPSFCRMSADGGTGVLPVDAMRKRLKKYIRSG